MPECVAKIRGECTPSIVTLQQISSFDLFGCRYVVSSWHEIADNCHQFSRRKRVPGFIFRAIAAFFRVVRFFSISFPLQSFWLCLGYLSRCFSSRPSLQVMLVSFGKKYPNLMWLCALGGMPAAAVVKRSTDLSQRHCKQNALLALKCSLICSWVV